MSSEYSERVDLFLFQIRSLGVLYSLTMRIVASSLKEGEFRIKDIGESVPKRIFLSLFFQNLIFTKRLILLYSLPEHRKKLIFIVFRFNVFGSFLMPVKIPQNSDSVLQLIQSISRHGQCISSIFIYRVCVCSVTQSCLTPHGSMNCGSTWAPLPVEFSRYVYRSRLPCPTSGNHLLPGIKPRSLELTGRFCNTVPHRNPIFI